MENRIRGFRLALIILCFVSFFMYALMHNIFGANAANILSYFGIDEARGGLILTVQAVSSLVVTIYLGLFGERHNKILWVACGVGIFAAAGVLIGLIPGLSFIEDAYPLMLLLSLGAGLGYILVDLLTNGLVADVFPENKSVFLPYVHAFYSVGSMAAPIFVTSLVDPENAGSFSLPYLVGGVTAAVVFAAFIFTCRKVTPSTPYAELERSRSAVRNNPMEIFKESRAWLYFAACFFFMCFQTGIATWLPTFCSNQIGYDFRSAGLMVTMYFIGSLSIRFLSPLIYKIISVRAFYVSATLASIAVFLLFLLLPMPASLAKALIILMGLLQGCGVPALVILVCEAFPTRTASASSLILLGVCLSILIVPPLMGYLMGISGYLIPMLIIALSLLIAALVMLPFERIAKKKL